MKNKSEDFKTRLRSKDVIFAKCYEIASLKGIAIEDHEYQYLKQYHDTMLSSELGGSQVHQDVMQALCHFCLQESLFQAGMELLVNDKPETAIHSLEKAKTLIPWPTCAYALGLAHSKSSQKEQSSVNFSLALELLDDRIDILNKVVPESLPDRKKFIAQLRDQLDGQVRLLGFENMEELKTAVPMALAEAKIRCDSVCLLTFS